MSTITKIGCVEMGVRTISGDRIERLLPWLGEISEWVLTGSAARCAIGKLRLPLQRQRDAC